jgi:hypothetical protein
VPVTAPGMVSMGKCVDCGNDFELDATVFAWYKTEGKQQGLHLPRRCQKCLNNKRDRKFIRARRHILELRLVANSVKTFTAEELAARLNRIADELENVLS